MTSCRHIFDKIRSNKVSQIFIIFLRYLLGFSFVLPSFIKIQGERFTAVSGADAPFGSMFHFFETMFQTGIYWNFIGVGQFIAGALLLTQKYSKLGSLIYLTIITNIVFIVWSLEFGIGTPLITSLMMLGCILLIVWDYDTFKVLINRKQGEKQTLNVEEDVFWAYLGIFYLIISCITGFVDRHNSIYLIIPFAVVGIVSILWKFKKYRTLSNKN